LAQQSFRVRLEAFVDNGGRAIAPPQQPMATSQAQAREGAAIFAERMTHDLNMRLSGFSLHELANMLSVVIPEVSWNDHANNLKAHFDLLSSSPRTASEPRSDESRMRAGLQKWASLRPEDRWRIILELPGTAAARTRPAGQLCVAAAHPVTRLLAAVDAPLAEELTRVEELNAVSSGGVFGELSPRPYIRGLVPTAIAS
jgi:hypothetical protein